MTRTTDYLISNSKSTAKQEREELALLFFFELGFFHYSTANRIVSNDYSYVIRDGISDDLLPFRT
jgi:hypothetical protein